MIYITENVHLLTEDFLKQTEHLLSVQRAEKIKEYSLVTDRINGTAAYLLLRYALKTEYGIVEKPVFKFCQREKPFLQDHSNIFFNLSHCKNAVACILSDTNTAIDVMDIRKVRESTIRRTCTENEKSELLASSDTDRDFIRLWTRKECYAKLDGKGLLLDFSNINEALPEMKDIHTLDFGDHILSYYSQKPVEIVFVSTEKLLDF